MKGHLSQGKRWPFIRVLIIKWLQSRCKRLYKTAKTYASEAEFPLRAGNNPQAGLWHIAVIYIVGVKQVVSLNVY